MYHCQTRIAGLTHLAALSASLLLIGCQTVQTTQPGQVGVTRTQNMVYSQLEVNEASQKSYKSLVREASFKRLLNRDEALNARVDAIARRLIDQTVTFREDAKHWEWEIRVFQSDQINAFCLSGGKIGIYTGMLNKLQLTDSELAAVLGHEIAHALREHVREAASLSYLGQVPGMVLSFLTGIPIFGQLGGVVGQVAHTLPHSRQVEAEADDMGLELAARAGFDPRAALSLWQKMNTSVGSSPPEFLSTHPAPQTRAQDLSRTIDKLLPIYWDVAAQ